MTGRRHDRPPHRRHDRAQGGCESCLTPSRTDLSRYFAIRQQQRADRVTEALDALTARERHLVHEAAVMGYVRGTMALDKAIPPDSDIVALVVACCQSMSDIYPVIAGNVCEVVRSTVRRNGTAPELALIPAVAELCGCDPEVVRGEIRELVDDAMLVEAARWAADRRCGVTRSEWTQVVLGSIAALVCSAAGAYFIAKGLQ